MKHPILYSFRRCPYAMRARLALFGGAVPFVLREIALKDKPAAFVALSPKATVPVLQLTDGTVLEESLDIVRWVFAEWRTEHSTRHAWDLYENSADINRFAEDFESDFKAYSDGYKYGDNKESDFAEAVNFLKTCEARLQKTAYFFGDTPSLADIAALPFVRQFAKVDEARFFALPVPKLQARLKSFLACRLFQEVMRKRPLWGETDKDAPLLANLPTNLGGGFGG